MGLYAKEVCDFFMSICDFHYPNELALFNVIRCGRVGPDYKQ